MDLKKDSAKTNIHMITEDELEKEEICEGGETDSLTGLYRKNPFFRKAQQYTQHVETGQFCLMAIDIEHFKLFNEWYGNEEGDMFLTSISAYLNQAQITQKGLAGYMGGDDFCIILPNDLLVLETLQEQIIGYARQYGGNAGFLPAFGIYIIEQHGVSVSTMYDRACMAIASVKGNYFNRVCWYDTQMMQQLEENYKLLKEVQRALEQKEFIFYAQPQCNLVTGKIVGLESLVRWIHPERGLISPATFIPVLEQNGFITELDLYIWEMVCAWLRQWIDGGHRAISIAVNVSRIDIYSLDVVQEFCNLVEKHQIDPELLKIEITESAYAEEYQVISEVVEKLRAAGFTVLMDDFGSGYSSLNMLKDVNVDVIKIDLKFLDLNQKSAGKGLGILEAIIGMAQLMELRLIAEGVETEEQKELLLDRGCIYAQGYYFYRPLPLDDLEELLADEENLDFRGLNAKQIERLSVKELLNGDMLSEAILNNLLGSIAFYDLHNGKLRLLRVNEQYYKLIGFNPVELEEHKSTIMEDVYQEDHTLLLAIFEQAKNDPINGGEGEVRRFKGDGSTAWIHARIFFLKEQDGHKIFYGTIADVTEKKIKEHELWLVGQKMESLLRQAGINSWDWDIKEHMLSLTNVCRNHKLKQAVERLAEKHPVVNNFPECVAAFDFMEPEHRVRFQRYLKEIQMGLLADHTKFELPVTHPEYGTIWLQIACEVIQDEEGTPIKAVGYYVDITEQKTEYIKSKESIKALEVDALTGLYNRQTAIPKINQYLKRIGEQDTAALIMFDLDNFKLANDVFGHLCGDAIITENAHKLRSFFRDEDIVCRLGGDEFLILCKHIKEDHVEKKLLDIVTEMVVTYGCRKQEIKFSISAGYVMIPEMGVVFDELYKCADIALFAAKMEGKSSYRKYNTSMKEVRYELAEECKRDTD